MANLQTTFAGLALKNPLVAASSGLTNTPSKIKELENAGIGAVVLKSLFEEQIENHSEKLSQISDYPEAADYINAYIGMNHVEKHLDLIRSVKSECSIPVIASVNAYKLTRWVDFAKSLEGAGADAIELNLYLLNAGEYEDNYLVDSYQSILRELKRNIKIPIVVKMAKNIPNLPGTVSKLKSLGAGGVVLFNRFHQLDIDINTLEIKSGSVFSAPSDFQETLRWTAITSGRVPGIDIACSTGIHSWEEVVKGILAGGSVMQLCSVLYRQGAEVVGEMLTCLEEWMAQNNYASLNDFRGKLNYKNIESPSLYERVQFMKYFSGYQQ